MAISPLGPPRRTPEPTLYDAVGGVKRDPASPQFTDHYFSGDYPTRLTDLTGRGKSDPKTLSLMKEAS